METTRAKVIEKAIGFEELISQLLSMLLDIDKDLSKSFGSQGSSLSFNAKINLLIDLKFIPSEVSKDFQLFAEIRNKFAHVLYVDTFVKCFEIIDKNRNNFLKRFTDDVSTIDKNDESIYAYCFEILCFELGVWLRVTLKLISEKKSQEIRKTSIIEILRSFVELNDSERVKQLNYYLDSLKPIINQITPDSDFMDAFENELKKQDSEIKTKE